MRSRRGVLVAALAAAVLSAFVGAEGFTPAASESAGAGSGAGLVELPDLRTQTSRTYRGADGVNVTRIWQGAQHYRGPDGRWEAIENSFEATGSGFRNGANRWRVDVPEDASGAVRAQLGTDWVSFALAGASGAARSAGGRVVADALPGVQVRYSLAADMLKEELVLADAAAATTFRYALDASAGLTPRLVESGAIEFRDGTGAARLALAAPVMWDAAGAVSKAVSYDLERSGGEWELTVRADSEWVGDPDRRFPVTVDPTVTFSDSQDTYMVSGTGANTAFGPATNLSTGLHGDGRVYRSLLKFTMSGVPKQAIVMSAGLNLRSTGTGDATSTVAAHRATRAWTTGATWNKYDGTNTWSTTGGGGDFDATAEDTEGVTGNATGWETWHVGTLVQDWITGAKDNHGFLLKETTETANKAANFRSSTYSTSADQPYLQVEWHHRTGVSRQYTYDRHKINDRTELLVNVGNGNLIVKHQDVSIAGAGTGIAVNRYWNSLGIGWANMGSGWTTDVGADMWISQYDEGRYAFVFGPSMSVWKFKRGATASGVTSYDSPPAADAKLVWDSAAYEFRLTFNKTREVWVFDGNSEGIKERRDKNGNKISYVDTSGDGNATVNQIIDPQQSRTLITDDINTTGRLESITESAYDGGTGRTWSYGYSAYGTQPMELLTSYTDPASGSYTYNYGNGKYLQYIVDPRGNKTKFTWDYSVPRLTSITRVTDPVTDTGPTTTYTYNAAGSETCDVNGANVPALTTTVTDPKGNSTTLDPNDGKTVYRWDEKTLRVCKATNAAGHQADTKYTPNGDGNSFTDNPGGTGNSAVNTLNYDASPNSGNGNDPSNRLDGGTINKSPTNTATDEESFSLGYWSSSNRSGDQFPGLERQLARSFTDTDGNDTFYGYDTAGNVNVVKDDDTSPANQATLTYTDGTNLPGVPKGLLRTAADGRHTTTFNTTTTYNYNTKGQLTSVVPPLPVGTTSFTYDDSSRVKTATDGKGQVATFCYDKLDRTKRTYWSGGEWHEYDYDQNGNQTARRSGTGATSCTNAVTAAQTTSKVFDALNRQTSETFPGSVTNTYVYDVNSQLDTFTDPAGTVDYGYDQIDRVTAVAFPGTITAPWGTTQNIGIAYDDQQRKRTVTFPGTTGAANGVKLVTQSDKAGKPTLIQALDSADANLRKLEYAYRPVTSPPSQMKTLRYSETLTAGTGTPSSTFYKYDSLGRLCAVADVAAASTCPTASTAATFGTGATNRLEYVYDNASNRTLRRANGVVDWQAAYNAANQMCWSKPSSQSGDCTLPHPAGVTSYSYDNNGNLISGYTYDVRSRLSAINTSALSYLSPTNGELTDVAGQPFHNSLLGLSRKSSTTAAYLRTPTGELLMDRRSTGARAVIPDALGSTRWLLAGNSIDRGYSYTPDGVDTVSGLGPDIDIRFAGGHRVNAGDGSPLYHFGARYYRPNIARWTQRDPLDQPDDLRQANPYVYAGQDPINNVDLDGLAYGRGGEFGVGRGSGSGFNPLRGGRQYFGPIEKRKVLPVCLSIYSFACAAISQPVSRMEPLKEPGTKQSLSDRKRTINSDPPDDD